MEFEKIHNKVNFFQESNENFALVLRKRNAPRLDLGEDLENYKKDDIDEGRNKTYFSSPSKKLRKDVITSEH